MTGRIVNLSVPQALELCVGLDPDDLETMASSCRRSDPLLAGFDSDTLLCILGFIPATILSDEAYLWMCSTPAVAGRKIMFGRWAKRMIVGALERYPRIIGHCQKDSVGWLRHLGAKFGTTDFLVEFVIEKQNVRI